MFLLGMGRSTFFEFRSDPIPEFWVSADTDIFPIQELFFQEYTVQTEIWPIQEKVKEKCNRQN